MTYHMRWIWKWGLIHKPSLRDEAQVSWLINVTHQIGVGWIKWRLAFGVLCDRMCHRDIMVSSTEWLLDQLLYGAQYWLVKNSHVQKMNIMNIVDMRMLRWMCLCTRRDKIRNKNIRGKVGMTSVIDKMREIELRWFGHVKRRSTRS